MRLLRFFFLLSLTLLLSSCSLQKTCYTIVEVGACDEWGFCAIRAADGHRSTVQYPMKGDVRCVTDF